MTPTAVGGGSVPKDPPPEAGFFLPVSARAMGADAWEGAMTGRQTTTIDDRTVFFASGSTVTGRAPRPVPINAMPESPQ